MDVRDQSSSTAEAAMVPFDILWSMIMAMSNEEAKVSYMI
jgi:hypothetical protein